MLTFGFIADNIIEVPKGLTLEEFEGKFRRTLFNNFFEIVEQGSTKFYIPFQNSYSCIAINVIKKISEIADIDIEINVVYTDNEDYEAALSTPYYSKCDLENTTNKIIFSEINPELLKTTTKTAENSSDIKKFNVLMNLVEECSVVVFYNSDEVIEKNSYISTALNYCSNYSIIYRNLYGTIQ